MFKKHPTTLWTCVVCYGLVTFAFFDLVSLLVLYLTRVEHVSTIMAYELYGAFFGIAFTLAVAGGYIASHFGYKNASIIGLIACSIGGVLVYLPGIFFTHIGLALFATGFGITTPAFYELVGLSYKKVDIRRESGYTLFYLLFNGGNILGIFTSSFIALHFGYKDAFSLAGAASIVALLYLILFHKTIRLGSDRHTPEISHSSQRKRIFLASISAFALSFLTWVLLHWVSATDATAWALMFISSVLIFRFANKQTNKTSRARLLALLVLCLISVIYWSVYMLEASFITLFAVHNVIRHFSWITIPPSLFFSLDPTFVFLLGLIATHFWHRLAQKGKNPSIPNKFISALFIASIGFFVLLCGIHGHTKMNPLWLVLAYVFFTIGELLIAPIGMAMIDHFSPHGYEGKLMGFWTLCISFAAILSGYVGKIFFIPKSINPAVTNPAYFHTFLILGASLLGVSIITLCFLPWMKRLVK